MEVYMLLCNTVLYMCQYVQLVSMMIESMDYIL